MFTNTCSEVCCLISMPWMVSSHLINARLDIVSRSFFKVYSFSKKRNYKKKRKKFTSASHADSSEVIGVSSGLEANGSEFSISHKLKFFGGWHILTRSPAFHFRCFPMILY